MCFTSQHGLKQEDYDLITQTEDYSMRRKPSEADIETLKTMYKCKCNNIILLLLHLHIIHLYIVKKNT